MSDIKHCPFCGNQDVQIGEPEPGKIAIDCPECECVGPFGFSIESAIELWNIPSMVEEAHVAERATLLKRLAEMQNAQVRPPAPTERGKRWNQANAKVSGAGPASAGLPG